MNTLWDTLSLWFHTLVSHGDGGTAQAVGQATAKVTAQLDTTSLLALAGALGWASGFRLYAVVFLVGMAGWAGWIPLPTGLLALQHPAVLIVSGALLSVEFFADKIPGLDSLWDMANSVVRIPAGAALAAAALGADSSSMAMIGALLGGGLAATAQAAKTTTRAAINTSPEPFSNVIMSLLEDGLVVGIVWLASHQPLIFAAVLLVAVATMWAVTWMLFKFLRAVLRRMRSFFSVLPPPRILP